MAPRLNMNISFSGPAGCGKDTIGKALAETHSEVTVMKWADALWGEMIELVNDTGDAALSLLYITHRGESFTHSRLREIEHNLKTRNTTDPTVREIIQRYGTDYRRSQNPNYWVERFEESFNEIDGTAIITDTRFPNELEWARSKKFVTFHIDPPEEIMRRNLAERGVTDVEYTQHSSENSLRGEKFHFTIRNSGTVEESVAEVLEKIDWLLR